MCWIKCIDLPEVLQQNSSTIWITKINYCTSIIEEYIFLVYAPWLSLSSLWHQQNYSCLHQKNHATCMKYWGIKLKEVIGNNYTYLEYLAQAMFQSEDVTRNLVSKEVVVSCKCAWDNSQYAKTKFHHLKR